MLKFLPASARRVAVLSSIAVCLALLGPSPAGAATVVNGDFETGNLSGWQVNDSNPGGTWMAYTGSSVKFPLVIELPEEEEITIPVPAPPQGSWGAITVQGGPGRHILYQDVALEPYYTHQLSLTAYYASNAPLVAQGNLDPGGLMEEGPPNQQYRIDVMKPSAALDSLAPGDILATVFAAKTGDSASMGATSFSADLTPFAGQTVRLRMVEVDNQGPFNAGVDAVSILSTPPSNAIKLGKVKFNKKKGTAKLSVTVPGPGELSLTGQGVAKQKKSLKAAATAKLLVKAKGKKRKKLNTAGKAKLKAKVTFTPAGGLANTKTKKLTLKKRLG